MAKKGIELFNCTEGGIFIDGFEHISLSDFFRNKMGKNKDGLEVQDIFLGVKRDQNKYDKDKKKLNRFIKDNIKLGQEVERLSKVAVEIAKKPYHTDEDLQRFDLVQNKAIKAYQELLLYA